MEEAAPRTRAHDTLTEVADLQALARAAGVSFTFPLLLFGAAGLCSAVLLRWSPLWLYTAWWLVVALLAPPLIAAHYSRRLRRRGVGVDRKRALRHVLAAETLATLLWVQPWHPANVSLPWLALALGAVVAGHAWRDHGMHVAAAGVAGVVVVAAALGTPMAWTDLGIGTWLIAVALWWRRPRTRQP